MKKLPHISLAILLSFFLSCPSLLGQNALQTKQKQYYKTWINTMDQSSKINGYLIEAGDSLTLISSLSDNTRISIPVSNIQKIKFRAKGKLGRTVLFGALAGFMVGGVIGLSREEEDYSNCYLFCTTRSEKAWGAAWAGTQLGALLGGIIGIFKIKFPINGDVNYPTKNLMKYKLPNAY